MGSRIDNLPKAFIWRRLHSLTGLWLVLFLIEHLLTNSQAALLIGDSGEGFVRMVNWLHNLPYLTVLEVTLLGVPILIHGIWGIKYALTAKPNSQKGGDRKPHMKYGRNRAYTWQRITSWILLVLLVVHVAKFRFIDYPDGVNTGTLTPTYFVKVQMDPGLYTVAQRLDVKLYDKGDLDEMARESRSSRSEQALSKVASEIRAKEETRYSSQNAKILESAQCAEEKQKLYRALSSVHLEMGEVVAAATNFGTASLLTVRNTFKNPIWVAVYTVFVLSACFHAFQGLWTSMLTWGWVVKVSAQAGVRKITIGLMILLAFLGLAAVWGTYFLNLKT
ncbi:MAG: Succinate dehydrogenase cytochrome b558 subunit [Chlamydiae bacterium]|nr:Succinate dehydrogenase cytochrome b558 subunit [Chlamydiota bacterium]